MSQIKAAGFDFVRLVVAPGPWIDAVAASDSARLAYLFGLYDTAVDSLIAAGLGVEIDLHDSYYVKNTPTQLLAAGVTGTLFQNRLTVTGLFASRYSTRDPKKLALELFNEPLAAANITGLWSDYLKALYRVARARMPNHTLLLTMENYSGIDQLVASDPGPFDTNTLWVIHPYIPAIFAIQGYTTEYNKYVYNLDFPPDSSKKTAAISAMTANVNADGTLTAPQKTAEISAQTTQLNFYFDTPLGSTWIDGELAKITPWTTKYRIATSRIIANEYGVTRTNALYTGTPAASRVLYLNSIGPLMWARGYRSSIFSIDADDYNVTDGVGSNVGNFLAGVRFIS